MTYFLLTYRLIFYFSFMTWNTSGSRVTHFHPWVCASPSSHSHPSDLLDSNPSATPAVMPAAGLPLIRPQTDRLDALSFEQLSQISEFEGWLSHSSFSDHSSLQQSFQPRGVRDRGRVASSGLSKFNSGSFCVLYGIGIGSVDCERGTRVSLVGHCVLGAEVHGRLFQAFEHLLILFRAFPARLLLPRTRCCWRPSRKWMRPSALFLRGLRWTWRRI